MNIWMKKRYYLLIEYNSLRIKLNHKLKVKWKNLSDKIVNMN
jgi:hypothetical protein